MSSFEQQYPHITSWVRDGCLEIGNLGYSDDASFIRVIDEGDVIWDCDERFGSLDEALTAADTGIAKWCDIHIPALVVEADAPPTFTAKQGQYLAYIYNYTQIHGKPPAEADLQAFFRVTPPTVHQMILKLDQLNFISRIPGQARSLQILVAPEHLPILKRP